MVAVPVAFHIHFLSSLPPLSQPQKQLLTGLLHSAAGKDDSKPGPFNFGSAAPAFSFKPLQGGFPAVTSIFGSKADQTAGIPPDPSPTLL